MSHYLTISEKHNIKKRGRDFWGQSWWNVLHSSAGNYTPNKKAQILCLLTAYTVLLPCGSCAVHFLEMLKTKIHPEPYLKDRDSFLYFTYMAHDAVNRRFNIENPDKINKISPTFQDVKKKYIDNTNYGESWWEVLHGAAAVYKPYKKAQFLCLLNAYVDLLPNSSWRENFKKIITNFSPNPYLINNEQLFLWTYLVHDMVNKYNNAKISPSYKDIRARYFNALNESCPECKVF